MAVLQTKYGLKGTNLPSTRTSMFRNIALLTHFLRQRFLIYILRLQSCCSITDELETMCGLLSPPRSPCMLSPPRRCESGPAAHTSLPRQRTRHASEMSNSEMAAFLEKETLRDAEENDYQLMQDLIQHRIHRDVSNDAAKFDNNAFFMTVSEDESRQLVSALRVRKTVDFHHWRPSRGHFGWFCRLSCSWFVLCYSAGSTSSKQRHWWWPSCGCCRCPEWQRKPPSGVYGDRDISDGDDHDSGSCRRSPRDIHRTPKTISPRRDRTVRRQRLDERRDHLLIESPLPHIPPPSPSPLPFISEFFYAYCFVDDYDSVRVDRGEFLKIFIYYFYSPFVYFEKNSFFPSLYSYRHFFTYPGRPIFFFFFKFEFYIFVS